MIQLLATKYSQRIAYILFLLFLSGLAPVYGRPYQLPEKYNPVFSSSIPELLQHNTSIADVIVKKNQFYNDTVSKFIAPPTIVLNESPEDIGGPSQPEMSSFKSVGTDNMVNIFTGDFNYNIPLMDVGGYPINIFYNGGITMEQEASWVGLGWNINPGNINRNMRGLPDDFDGTDTMLQTQKMKPNNTWGVSLGADLEVVGLKNMDIFKGSVGASLGISFNNYLGPALELGVKGTTNFSIAKKAAAEKNATPGISAGLNINLSSRNGLTLSPNVSLTATAAREAGNVSVGVGLSTSYNSRSGIKGLQLSEQLSFSNSKEASKMNSGSSTISQSIPMYSTSISFTKPSYIPSLRLPLTNSAYSGHYQLGTGLFGAYGSVEAEVYRQRSEIVPADTIQKKPMVGYLYYQKAKNNTNAVMDFTRFNDGEVTPNSTIISVPQYTYDVFSIQGEGTGGSVRAYRNDQGFVRDNTSRTQDKNISAGVDAGPPGHFGGNFSTIKTPSYISGWINGNRLLNANGFGFREANEAQENVYFRNPGETSVLDANQFKKIGEADLVRYKLGGTKESPTIEPILEQFSKSNDLIDTATVLINDATERKKRTQVTSFLTAEEATNIGLDTVIKNYNPATVLNGSNNLQYDTINRVNIYRKKNHISQINVTEASGKRYIYGLPVYNIIQKDFTFTSGSSTINDADAEKINFAATEPYTLNTEKDGFIQTTETPAYAHSFLLSGLLSPDYVDVTGDGITEDDMGDAVKFNYTKYADHKWRTPLTSGSALQANFNAGKRTEKKDDKAIITYGKRESWYTHSIESKTMIAIFTVEDRKDAKGASGEFADINTNDNSSKRLKKIDLFSKADLKKNGITNAKPIKTVWFAYSYKLCGNTPDNNGAAETINGINVNANAGKLTLDSIYFTFNGKSRLNKNKYVFSYGGTSTNPSYSFNASDRWGNYKPSSVNPSALKNGVYPYSLQDKTQKNTIDSNAAAWSLKKILLPSGGQIEVDYESDDYAFVQNRRAADMIKIAGFGKDSFSIATNKLYGVNATGISDNRYVFIKVPEPCANKTEVYEKYLKGITQLAFKIGVNMPKGIEYVNSYATIDDYGRVQDAAGTVDVTRIWIRLNTTDGISPLTLTALEYLREHLPGQAFEGYDVSESAGLKQVGEMLTGMLSSLTSAFANPLDRLRSEGKAQTVDTLRSFVRLNDPDGFKYGGGQRVKSVRLKDNWKAMTNQYTSVYGQEYDYTTTEIFNGTIRAISSGVASYEPSVGGEENPFQTIEQVSNKLPLGPTSYGAIEMPVMDAFFPAPVVGYSKVSVTAIKRGDFDTTVKKTRSGIGKQVSEFYTAKDYPVYYKHTSFDPTSDRQQHTGSAASFLYKYAFDSRALSQGFLIETNDMHGKMKSQSSYAENDLATRISYTENFYRNSGNNGMNEKFDFVYGSKGGVIEKGNMGIDIELMTDTREFSVKSSSLEVQGQMDCFPVIIPFWLPFIWPVAGNSENTYRAVTTTKVISYHGILDSVIAIDKGSKVTTKNLVYDAETGEVVVNRTNNEFDTPVYSVNYPSYWAYSGMGLAYKNIDAVFTNINFVDGKIVSGIAAADLKKYFESGDELYIIKEGSPSVQCEGQQAADFKSKIIWAYDLNKTNSSLTNTNPGFVFMDAKGKLYNNSGVKFRIVRSGKRNMIGASAASITLMASPIITTGQIRALVISNTSKVINASAVEFQEKWQVDNDVMRKYKMVQLPDLPQGNNLITNGDFSAGFSGFTSGYTYGAGSGSGPTYGTYFVGTTWPWANFNCRDHTTGSGKSMYVDGATTLNKDVLSQTVAVQPNRMYQLSAWFTNRLPTGFPKLAFYVNSIKVGTDLQLTSGICDWVSHSAVWYSGNSQTATITIQDAVTVEEGNDFSIDDISFYALARPSCNSIETEDCNGYLEKNINPYRKGLLGNFRVNQSKVFYADRADVITDATNIKKNGFLKDFSLYWNFDGSNNLIPNANEKWVWNSQVTRFNTKGLELETKDALNIYTSAQYGFNKTVPVAIANNARYDEAANESFEDYDYSGGINANAGTNTCAKKHIDFTGSGNSAIVTSDATGFSAHTGKNMLKVNVSSEVSKSVAITNNVLGNYGLYTENKITQSLAEPGGTFIPAFIANPSNLYIPNPAFPAEDLNTINSSGYIFCNNCYGINMQNGVSFSNIAGSVAAYRDVDFLSPLCNNAYTIVPGVSVQYVEITESNTYQFSVVVQDMFSTNPPLPSGFVYSSFNYGKLSIYNVEGNVKIAEVVSPPDITINQFEYKARSDNSLPVYLCKGKYKLSFLSYQIRSTSGYCITSSDTYYLSSLNTISYKNLSTQNGCSYTKPIAATDSMLNPIFSIPVNKKMLFSAWVRESNTQVTSYTNNKVTLQYDGGSAQVDEFKPTGPVIEGWQRYEGYFTAPANATNMTMKFINTGSSPVYFDDIRIHPYNANMKSYVYDPVNLRLTAELDANNYARFYEYDEEGTLIRTKAETKEGIKTITETRSFKQRAIKEVQ